MCVAERNPIISAFPSLRRDICLACIVELISAPTMLPLCWSKISWDVKTPLFSFPKLTAPDFLCVDISFTLGLSSFHSTWLS